MMGTDKQQASKAEELLCEVMDLRNKMVGFAYGKNGEKKEAAEKLVTQIKVHLDKFEEYLSVVI